MESEKIKKRNNLCEHLLEYLRYCKKKECFIGIDEKYCEKCKNDE